MLNPSLLIVLARTLIAGEQDVDSIIARIKHAIGKRGLPGIARRYIAAFAGKPRPRQIAVQEFLLNDRGFHHIRNRARKEVPIQHWLTESQTMQPVAAARAWQLPVILSLGELAAWLRLTPGELAWFADPLHINRKRGNSPLHHYTYAVIPKRTGGIRLLESPKQHLKLLQRQILGEILNSIPSHPAAHGFVPGRSIHTFTAPHAHQPLVLRLDIADFFPSIVTARIQAFFRTVGYPDAVAFALAGISTNSVPASVWPPHRQQIGIEETARLRQLYTRRHLPQGAPTSPALANFCAYRLDCRLTGLAQAAGATYTRYADDLAFSGDDRFARGFTRDAQPFADRVAAILLEEGFHAHYRKTRIMRASTRQHLAGLVVNAHPNIPREDCDRLKATLTNCLRQGSDSQNRESHPDFRAHLLGRIAFVATVNPTRAAKLRAIFDQISW